MSTIFRSDLGHQLQDTLEDIIDDDMDGIEDSLAFRGFMKEGRMDGAMYDVLEMGGPGLAQETGEGEEMPTETIREGVFTRHVARKFALKLQVTEEALKDGKYPEAIRAAMRLKMSAWQTVDVDAALVLARMFDTNYFGGDGLPLGSASHTLPHGGTFSNVQATPMTPSVQSIALLRTQAKKLPGHNGIIYGYKITGFVFPVDHWDTFAEIVGSRMSPEAGNFAKINVVNQTMKIRQEDLVEVHHWSNTETNWAALTNCDEGRLRWFWRERPSSRTWVDNNHQVMNYAISYRATRGWNDPRGILCVNA